MEPRGDSTGVRDGFFYPESTVVRAAARAKRPPGRGPRGPRLPWLLCALLVAGMAAAGTWVVAPLRRQLAQARANQAAAVANVLQLQAERQVALTAPPPAILPAPAVDEGVVWAEAQVRSLGVALAEDVACHAVTLRRVGARVEVEVSPSTGGAHGARGAATGRLFAAVGRALAADESPYRLTLFVPTPKSAAPAPTRHAAHRRRRRGRRVEPPPAPTTSPDELAAAAASRALIELRASLAQRPRSTVEGAFGHAAEDAPPFTVQLRLERAVP